MPPGDKEFCQPCPRSNGATAVPAIVDGHQRRWLCILTCKMLARETWSDTKEYWRQEEICGRLTKAKQAGDAGTILFVLYFRSLPPSAVKSYHGPKFISGQGSAAASTRLRPDEDGMPARLRFIAELLRGKRASP